MSNAHWFRKTGRLKQILPEEFRDTNGIEQNILKVVEVVGMFRNVINTVLMCLV